MSQQAGVQKEKGNFCGTLEFILYSKVVSVRVKLSTDALGVCTVHSFDELVNLVE